MLNKKIIWRAASNIDNETFGISDLIKEIEKEVEVYFDDNSMIIYNINDILEVVSSVSRLDRTTIMSKTRRRDIVQARQIGMYLLYKYTRFSYQKVGSYFGKDHATAIHSENKIKDALRGFDPNLKEKVEECERMLKMQGKYEIKDIRCMVNNCNNKVFSKGLCKHHYGKGYSATRQ